MTPKRIFICHASHDGETAATICRLLEKRGLPCWISPRDVRPGLNYGEAIIDALESCLAVIIVLSEAANASIFVKNEVERAVSKGKTVFPVRIRDVKPSKSLELFISGSQWIDAFHPPLESTIDRVADAIFHLFPVSPEPSPPPASSPSPASSENVSAPPSPSPGVPVPPMDPQNLEIFGDIRFQTGTASVVSVRDPQTGESFLLKSMAKNRMREPKLDLASMNIAHSSIASPLRQWEDLDHYYELLPLVDGWTLQEIMDLNRGIVGWILTKWCEDLLVIAKRLQDHRPPLIHRDINPKNILVRKDGTLSLVLIDCTTMTEYPTRPDLVPMGTPGYTGPEAIAGHPDLSSDIYSIGCTIYALNRGKPPGNPFVMRRGESTLELLDADSQLDAIFLRLVSTNSSVRFPDALTALQSLVEAHPKGTVSYTFLPTPMILPDGSKIDQYKI